MAQQMRAPLDKVDPVWTQIRDEAEEIVRKEPELATFIYSTVLHHDNLEAAVVHRVSERLDSPELPAELIRQYSTREVTELRFSPDDDQEALADKVADLAQPVR